MQPFKDVEKVRKAYHQDPMRNSVHLSSLLVPELAGTEVSISFVNHFLLKRDYKNIACRITAVDRDGKHIGARLVTVNEPRVYTIIPAQLFEEPSATYIVDFFSVDNLFIPFPAVVVNHRGETFLNSVHSYNRILNDVFEDDRINNNHVREASIDVRLDDDHDTFVVFTSGVQPVESELRVELADIGKHETRTVSLSVPRLHNLPVSLKELFPDFNCSNGSAVLKVDQPIQFMFYGRMLGGIKQADGAFSANHSYYDNSANEEYWEDDSPSYAAYPIFPQFRNRIRMYPIMSPGALKLSASFHDSDGNELGRESIGTLTSPGDEHAEADITDMAARHGGADVASYCLYAAPEGGNTPTRVNHQLIYDAGGLACSVNASLDNKNIFVPPTKTGRSWGQTVVGGGYNSWLAFYGRNPNGKTETVVVSFYDASGQIDTHKFDLPACSSALFDMEKIVGKDGDPRFVWYMAESQRPDLGAIVVSQNLTSGHCSGEHSF